MAQEVKGDAGAGEEDRHVHRVPRPPGLPGELPVIYKVPKIAGQNAKYIVAALNGYKTGDRKHPSMRGIAGSMSDQDMADVAAYYEKLGKGPARRPCPSRPRPTSPSCWTRRSCVACHGKNFNNTDRSGHPRSPANTPTTCVALKAYMTDNNPRMGRTTRHDGHGPAVHPRRDQGDGGEVPVLSLPGELKTVELREFR